MNDKEMIKTTMDNLRKNFDQSKVMLKPTQGMKKYSEIFHNYMAPAIEENIHDKESLDDILNCGQIIWNYVVAQDFPKHPKSMVVKTIFSCSRNIIADNDFITKFINRKRKMFGNDNFFIIQHSSLLADGGRMAISVVVELLEDSH